MKILLPYKPNLFWFTAINVTAVILFLFFWRWMASDYKSFVFYTKEDQIVECLTALFFLLASLIMLIAVFKPSQFRAIFILGWVLLFFFCAGEETSWGQRMLGHPTPEFMQKINMQKETNIHNLKWVCKRKGGSSGLLDNFVLIVGVLIPILNYTTFFRKRFSRWGVPIVQLEYLPLFLGGYLFGKLAMVYVIEMHGIPFEGHFVGGIYLHSVFEVKELMYASGFMLFAIHTFLQNRDSSLFNLNMLRNK